MTVGVAALPHTWEPAPKADDALVAEYARGNLAAFDKLYARYEARVYGFCVRYIGDHDRAMSHHRRTASTSPPVALMTSFISRMRSSTSFEHRTTHRPWRTTVLALFGAHVGQPHGVECHKNRRAHVTYQNRDKQ